MRYQLGFGIVEILLVILVVAVLAVTSVVTYQHLKNSDARINTAASPTQTTSQQKSSTTASTPVTPVAFVNSLLGVLASGDEAKLEQLLTPAFKNFRRQKLATGPCNYPPTQSLVCDSLLDVSATHSLSSLSPTVTDFTFKDGQKGTVVMHQLTIGGSDPGTSYFTFYLLPHNDSWLLNDYGDVFVDESGTYSLIPGEMESGR